MLNITNWVYYEKTPMSELYCSLYNDQIWLTYNSKADNNTVFLILTTYADYTKWDLID